jgi:amino acid transporter
LEWAIGPWAGRVISLLICISALGAINGQIFTGARIYYAMGSDHRLYSWLGQWDARRGQPVRSLLVQGAITLALVVAFGSTRDGFKSMVIFTTPAFWFFLMLVGMSLFVLRRRDPHTRRPYRVFGYPFTPILFCLSCAFMVYASVDWAVTHRSWEAMWSIAILLVGAGLSIYSPESRPAATRDRACSEPD